ncbi:MAG: bifunctional folylpolyglutamate synthase/dihydrofolate synthase [Acidobacteria bacterium]|nr:bifunctional folylpolyglutamate synthase/dihydrofolate synthase [Acidobacteriota bacterium]
MTYDEAVRYLIALGGELAAPWQPAPVAKFDLRNITTLAEALGSPHRAVPCAHIAGTNGKGSTAAFLASILQHAGLKTGLYTSPHLERINERIRINGEDISDENFAVSFTRIRSTIEELLARGARQGGLSAHPTFFECVTAMAFESFTRHGVDFAVYEVGLGGRLDSTNIVAPEVCIITQIDFDHETFLGHSIEEIAAEKAGIIKPGVPVVCSAERPEARAVIERRAAELSAPFTHTDEAFPKVFVGANFSSPERIAGQLKLAPTKSVVTATDAHGQSFDLHISLAGRFQVRNALAAVAAARVLAKRGFPITDAAITSGIAATRWPGRLEKLQDRPTVYLDGTHNPAGARELLAFWQENFAGHQIHLVFGAVRDKAIDEVAGLLFPHAASVILTAPHTIRAVSAETLAHVTAHHAFHYEIVPEPEAALDRALELAQPEDVVFLTGSLYLVGDLRHYWKQRYRTAAT